MFPANTNYGLSSKSPILVRATATVALYWVQSLAGASVIKICPFNVVLFCTSGRLA